MVHQIDENTYVLRASDPEGNVFFLMGFAKKMLEKQGRKNEAKEMIERITNKAASYKEALEIMKEYGIEFILVD